MARFRTYDVSFTYNVERTYRVTAKDEESAIKIAREAGQRVNETEDACELSSVEIVE